MNESTEAQQRNRWLRFCLGTYVLSIAFFALLYYRAYESDERNFAFNGDITFTQQAAIRQSLRRDIAEERAEAFLLTRQLAALRPLCKNFEERTDSPVATVKSIHEEYLLIAIPPYKYKFSALGSRGGISRSFSVHQNGEEVFSEIFSPPEFHIVPPMLPDNLKEYRKLARGFRDQTKDRLNRINHSIELDTKRLQRVEVYRSDIWNLMDFFYFSTITQTTVGYGDILPNSTYVRVLVVFQTGINLFIVIYAINLAFVRRDSPPEKPTEGLGEQSPADNQTSMGE